MKKFQRDNKGKTPTRDPKIAKLGMCMMQCMGYYRSHCDMGKSKSR